MELLTLPGIKFFKSLPKFTLFICCVLQVMVTDSIKHADLHKILLPQLNRKFVHFVTSLPDVIWNSRGNL